MGTTSANLSVTIVTKTGGDETDDLLLEAEIESSDNNGQSTYYVNETYYFRLFKSPNITTLSSGCNAGSISQVSSGLTTTVPYEGEDDEYITFTGSETASLNKVFNSGFSYTQMGKVFDVNGNVTSASLSTPASGSKTVIASKAIYGVFKVAYTTKYDKWSFSSPTAGPMIIFFIGTSSS